MGNAQESRSAKLAQLCFIGYTKGMKTAISISDSVFAQTDRFARRVKKSRSKVVSEALQEYLARHSPDEVTEAMNRAMDTISDASEPLVNGASRRVLRQVEW